MGGHYVNIIHRALSKARSANVNTIIPDVPCMNIQLLLKHVISMSHSHDYITNLISGNFQQELRALHYLYKLQN